jgi:hypothetical protein
LNSYHIECNMIFQLKISLGFFYSVATIMVQIVCGIWTELQLSVFAKENVNKGQYDTSQEITN